MLFCFDKKNTAILYYFYYKTKTQITFKKNIQMIHKLPSSTLSLSINPPLSQFNTCIVKYMLRKNFVHTLTRESSTFMHSRYGKTKTTAVLFRGSLWTKDVWSTQRVITTITDNGRIFLYVFLYVYIYGLCLFRVLGFVESFRKHTVRRFQGWKGVWDVLWNCFIRNSFV